MRATVTSLRERLSDRDMAILESLRSHRLLSTVLIRRLHFFERHATPGAAASAAMRVLTRLESLDLAVRMRRRIGGVRAGSSGITWHLGAAGERLLRTLHGDTRRRRYPEPEPAFVDHTLAKAELAVQLHELSRERAIELLRLNTEPDNWRSFVGPLGAREWLKPDLDAVTATGEYEDHWFLEADLATEHLPHVVRKAKVYQRYAATGAYQARHGLFPAVVWVVPDETRQTAIQTALAADQSVQPTLFRVVTVGAFAGLFTSGHNTAPQSTA